MTYRPGTWPGALLAVVLVAACGGNEADERGVGAECATDDDCFEEGQRCLLQFKGGYCGVENCAADVDCPEFSVCVAHIDGSNYCFRTCIDKPECNVNRSLENESNCSSSVDYVDTLYTGKACIPPSG